jgi:hypothetical protein
MYIVMCSQARIYNIVRLHHAPRSGPLSPACRLPNPNSFFEFAWCVGLTHVGVDFEKDNAIFKA